MYGTKLVGIMFVVLITSFYPFVGIAADVIQPESSMEKIDTLTRQILLKEIQLERFIIAYRMHMAENSRLKGWRYFLSQETNASLSDAGFIVITSERGKNISSPQRVRNGILEDGLILRIIGNWIGAAGSLGEFVLNDCHERKLKKEGFSPDLAMRYVLTLRSELDQLLTERDYLVQKEQTKSLLSPKARIVAIEGAVLIDIRDLLLMEYSNFHISARRFIAFEQSLYLLDIARNAAAAAANTVSLLAVRHNNLHLDGPAGIVAVVSGGLTMVNPIISRVFGKMIGARQKRLIAPCTQGVPAQNIKKLDSDLLSLKKMYVIVDKPHLQPVNDSLSYLALYQSQDASYTNRLELTSREIRAGQRAATENIVVGTLTGGTYMATGVTFITAAFKYPDNLRRFNVLAFTGNLVSVGGSSLAMLDNLRIQIEAEINNHKLASNHLLPEQILQSRLAELDKIEMDIRK